jgi:hypothetical protein
MDLKWQEAGENCIMRHFITLSSAEVFTHEAILPLPQYILMVW